MKRFIFGFIIGSMISGGVVFAAIPNSRVDREYQKFTSDSNGNVAIRVVFTKK